MYAKHARLLIIFLASLHESLQVPSLASDSHYVAGVVEFRFAGSALGPEAQLEDNLKGYLEILSTPEANATDIIIFPEATLNNNAVPTFVPDHESRVVLCDTDVDAKTYHSFLVQLSCKAKLLRKYLVINVSEKEKCSEQEQDPRPCAPNDLNIYNTNVVFDRNGAVISRYRKVNLWGEPRNTTYLPEIGYFDTDFGVRFGHFICFDILFYKPAQFLVDEYNVRDIIFPTMWFSQLPFLTGVQFQHSWAFGNNVNLLAAGSSRPEVGTTGTGIYHGQQGTLVSVMNRNEGERRLYMAQVPKFRISKYNRRNIEHKPFIPLLAEPLTERSIFLKRDNLELYNTVLLDLNERSNSFQHELCYEKKFCCYFDLAWENRVGVPVNSKYYTYRLAVYDGSRKEDNVENNHVRNCAIFACTSLDLEDCGKIFANDSTIKIQPAINFTRITIEARYPNSKELLIMPNSLKDDLLPLEPTQFVWEILNKDNSSTVRYQLNESIPNLLTFAIYGNYYDDIGTIYTDGASSALTKCFAIYLIGGIFILTIWNFIYTNP